MNASSPSESIPNCCPACGKPVAIEPRETPCPHCHHLLWFVRKPVGDVAEIYQHGRIQRALEHRFLADAEALKAGNPRGKMKTRR